MYVDGSSFSGRLCWILVSGVAVFRAVSPSLVWLDAGLAPGKHLVPVAGDLSDLVDLVHRVQGHSRVVEKIANEGRHFAWEHLSVDACFAYLHHLLRQYASLFEEAPDSARVLTDSTVQPQGEARESSGEVW